MSEGDSTSAREVVIGILRDLQPTAHEITDETTLDSMGFDSMGVVQVLVEVESGLGITFQQQDLRRATFFSVRTVLDAVARAEDASR